MVFYINNVDGDSMCNSMLCQMNTWPLFTPLGHLMKEEAYIYWLLKNNKVLKEEIKNSFVFNLKEYKRYFAEETKWMKTK